MNKFLKKMLSSLITASLVASTIVAPLSVSADYTPMVEGDTVLNEWKFDFGAADSTPEEGYTLVAPDRNYVTSNDYGFLGIDEEGYKLGNTIDGFGSQEGQVITLAAGGGEGLYDGIGSVGEDIYGNTGEKYYPVRFALKVQDEQFFRVKATVTTLDPTKDANVSLYTSRKHPIIKNTALAAGETKTVEFSIRTTPIYYKGISRAIADEMVNVCVLGENSALAALEIQQVESLPVMWVLGDSTVTDGNTTLPYFDLQNYTGVGTGLTLYLPRTMAMVNEGEGGLDAHDNNHYNMVASRIQPGDYMYVEYGHNHKSDGTAGYLSALDKYFNKCTEVGANLLIVSPIERINQWDSANSVYTQSLNGYGDVGQQYVAEKVAAGATNIAYVDLNDYSINWYNKITADNGGNASAIKFYFQTGKGAGTDTTHPNDAGAEHLAYEFMKAAQAVTDETQKAVVEGFLTGMTEETPKLISEEITAGGLGGTAWPTYIVPDVEKYPVVINDVTFDENGNVSLVSVEKRPAEIVMDAYGIVVITIMDESGAEKGKIYAVDQVDNSVPDGSYTVSNFRGDVTLGENDTYSAIVMKALDSADGLVVDEEANLAYSAVYKPTDIVKHLIMDEDEETNETFDFYGAVYEGDSASSLSSFNGWAGRGSAGQTLTLGVDGETKYANIITDGAKNGAANQGSFYVSKDFVADEATGAATDIGTTGRYLISADVKYLSGGGLNFTFVTGNTASNPWGSQTLNAFTIGNSGVVTVGGVEAGTVSAIDFTNVKYILDMDLGTATMSVGGGDEVTVDLANYQTSSTTVSPSKLTGFMFEANKVAAGIQVANLTVAQLKQPALPEYTLSIAESNTEWGKVEIVPLATPTPEPEETTAPEETTTPEETTAPEQTTAPEETTAPEQTTAPEETTAPEQTTAPEETEAPAPVKVNLITNGDFTDGFTDWTNAKDGGVYDGTISDNAEYIHGDGKAITNKAEAGGSAVSTIRRFIPVEGGKTYNLSFYAYNTGAQNSNNSFMSAFVPVKVAAPVYGSFDGLTFKDYVTYGGQNSWSAEPQSEVSQTRQDIIYASGMNHKEYTITVPEDANYIMLSLFAWTPVGRIYFSDFELYEATTSEDTETETASLMDDETAATVTMTANYGGGVTVASDAAASVVVIVANYENGALKSFTLNPVEFTEAGTQTVEAAVGSKVMLWDSLSSMKPLAEAGTVPEATAEPTPEPTMPSHAQSVTAALNTVVTIKAEANEGYVFMGWRTFETDELVSSDAEYTFRLREDTNLIANFVKEPGVEDVVSYSVSATNSFIKGAAGSTSTMKLVNPVDSAGTPLLKVKNSDATWSCDDAGVDVDANGVVTFNDSFTMDGAETKNIVIKSVLNGIEKSCTITAYSYAYYEVMTDGATNFNGLFMTIAGKTAIVFPGASTTNTYTLSDAVALDKATTITFDNAWTGANTCGQLRTLNFKNSSGTTIFSMAYTWTTLQVNGTDLGSAVSQNAWTEVKIEIDPTTNVVTVTAGGASATTTLAADAGDIASVDFASASSVPGPEARALGISNFIVKQ